MTQFTGFTKRSLSNSAGWALSSALESSHTPLRSCCMSFSFFQIPSTLPPSFSADYTLPLLHERLRWWERGKRITKGTYVLSIIFLSPASHLLCSSILTASKKESSLFPRLIPPPVLIIIPPAYMLARTLLSKFSPLSLFSPSFSHPINKLVLPNLDQGLDEMTQLTSLKLISSYVGTSSLSKAVYQLSRVISHSSLFLLSSSFL